MNAGPLAEPRTATQRARRERILASAQRLLADREYEQIQVREVAEDAEVALGTLYRYFPSKEILYANALLDWSRSFEDQVGPRWRSDATDAQRLRAALRAAVRAFERAPTYYRLLTHLEVMAAPDVRVVFAEFGDRFGAALRGTLVDARPADAETIAYVASAVLGTALRSWALHGTPIRDVYDRIDATVALIFASPDHGARPG